MSTLRDVTSQSIGIAGTGRMARALGAILRRRGFDVVAVGGRNPEAARAAAAFVGAGTACSIEELPHHARRIILAVSDDAITDVARVLAAAGLTGGLVLHTCGAHGPEALEAVHRAGNAVGVMHPLQGVPTPERGVETLPGATFGCAGDSEALEWAREIAERLEGRTLAIDPARWALYHAAAVMVGNYACTLADSMVEMMEVAGIKREQSLKAFAPLMRASCESILSMGPIAALPGPISRGDAGTLRRHLAAFDENLTSETRNLYRAAGLRTVLMAAQKGVSAKSLQVMTDVLRNE